MTTENGKELGGHHCPDWDGLWVTPSSPEHEACTCYVGPAMTTNKPEVVAWGVPNSRPTERQPFMQLLHTQEGTQYPELLDPLIRLSDYKALQAECEQLRKDAAAALSGLPDSLPMEPYQTVDRGSPHYKAGWNACRRAMLAALGELMEDPVHDQ